LPAADARLVETAARALEARHEAKAERARAMDFIVSLLWERAALRALLREVMSEPGDPCTDAHIDEYLRAKDTA
jgi:hypothetical protein